MKRKRNFLLLEILIAMGMLLLFSVPLLRNPLCFYKNEIEMLKNIEKLKLKKEVLLEIKERLYENKILWENLSNRNKELAKVYELKKKIHIGTIYEEEIPLYYRLWTKKEKISENETMFREIKVQIEFAPFVTNKKYSSYWITIKKISLNLSEGYLSLLKTQ